MYCWLVLKTQGICLSSSVHLQFLCERIATLSTRTGIAEPFLLQGEESGNNYKLLVLNHSGKS